MKFDDGTMRRILDATFGAVATDVGTEAELGRSCTPRPPATGPTPSRTAATP